ncbi:hypothetical protein FCM35_KLT19354 [Carex littledalei]|uniref:Uncharacterized protein n=1 Tax=Carex littledalei TaxID=544730 RepID=A0A833RBR9_9POAL|nr:hypothetical protein FCM35_KLT19354 [Carex littledalei]
MDPPSRGKSVTTMDLSTGGAATLEIKPPFCLAEEVERLVADGGVRKKNFRFNRYRGEFEGATEVKRNEVRGCGPCAWERGERRDDRQSEEGRRRRSRKQNWTFRC